MCYINRASAKKRWPGGADECLPSHVSGNDGDEILTDIMSGAQKVPRICRTPQPYMASDEKNSFTLKSVRNSRKKEKKVNLYRTVSSTISGMLHC